MASNPSPDRFASEALSEDGFLDGRLRLWQPVAGYRAAADPVLLAAAVPAQPDQDVLELGCGAGVASLCLAARVTGLRLWGVEVQPAYADLARRNADRNGIAFDVRCADLRALPADLRRDFGHVIANPPYFAPEGGTPARDGGREVALREDTPLADWLAVAARRLAPGGGLTLIQAADRLADVLRVLPDTVGSVSVLPTAPRAGREAKRVILRARKGGRGAFRLLSPLVLHGGAAHDADRDDYTPEARAILRGGGAISCFG